MGCCNTTNCNFDHLYPNEFGDGFANELVDELSPAVCTAMIASGNMSGGGGGRGGGRGSGRRGAKRTEALILHTDFRLFLSAEEHGGFNTSLLQQSLKVTYEAPPGIKKNMQRTYVKKCNPRTPCTTLRVVVPHADRLPHSIITHSDATSPCIDLQFIPINQIQSIQNR